MFTQGKSDILEHRQISEQGTTLKEHPHALAQTIEGIPPQMVYRLAGHADMTLVRPKLPADQP